MKTIPISKPGAGPNPTPDANVQAAKASRERAIKILSTPPQVAQNSQVPIPLNANNISAEELSAVQPHQQESLQNNNPVEVKSEQTQDTSVASKPSETQETKLSDSQLAILARKERALRAKAQQQQQELQTKQGQWASEKSALEQRIADLEKNYISKQYLKNNPLDALQQAELTYDEITQQAMSATPTDPRVLATISRLQSTVEQLQGKLDSAQKGAVDAQTQQYQAALKQIKNDVTHLVKVDPSFEMIKATNSQQDVVDLIEATYKEEGRVMDVEEASKEVEDYLTEEASKLARVDKIKKRLAPPPVVKKTETEQQTQTPSNKQPQPMKTLTNTNSGSRKLSARERAMLAFKGELKS